MVCLGNICRSPLAEGILRARLEEISQPKSHFYIDSAGTAGYHIGSAPDRRSIAVAKKHNIDIQHLKARLLQKEDLDHFDYIFVMDKSNYQNVCKLASNDIQRNRVHFLLDELQYVHHQEVPDPYYGDSSDFEVVFRLIDKACVEIARKLNS